MKSLKRILANLTMVCMLASMFPMTFVQAAETDYNFSSEVTEFTKYGDSGVETKKGSFHVTKEQFEESGNLLVFTYDAYVPDFKDNKQTLYLQLKDNNNKVFSLGSKVGFLDGNRKMYAYNKETTENVGSLGYTNALSFNNMTTDASGGQWVNLKTVIKYDITKKAYVSWNYFNGKAIVTSENEVAKITYTPGESDLNAIQGRTSIGYTIGARCGADTEDKAGKIKVANIGLSVYSTTEFEKTIEVASGKNEVTVPVTNAKFKDDTTVPAEVKGGLIDVSNATVTATKNGTAVSGVTAANAVVAHSGSVNVADGSAFKLSGLPALVKGDVLRVTITNAMDANGTALSPIELTLTSADPGSEPSADYYNFSSEVTEFTKYGDSGVETKTGSFNVTKEQFEESGNLLVFTYDAYVPDFKDNKQTLYLQLKDNNNKVFSLGSKVGFLDGNRKMYAYNKETTENVGSLGYTNALSFNNMTTDASGGQWVNLKTVIKYDITKKAYVSWNYFNGKAIVTSENEVAKITYTPGESDLNAIQGRTSIGYTIGARCGADTEDKAGKIKVANIGLSVYSTTEFEKTIEVASGKNEVTVPVTNAKFKDDTTVPAEVKGGLIDVSNATVTATKNGTAVSGVTAANAVVAHSGSVNVADGSAFKLSGLPALVKGDVLKVTINGAMDANGTALSIIELTLYGTGTEQAITYSLKNSIIDKSSKKINVKVDAEKLFVDKEASGSAKIICASYSDAGVLLGVSVTDMNISDTNFTNGKYRYTNNIGYTDGAKEVKIFLFDNMENIKPLTEFQPFDV